MTFNRIPLRIGILFSMFCVVTLVISACMGARTAGLPAGPTGMAPTMMPAGGQHPLPDPHSSELGGAAAVPASGPQPAPLIGGAGGPGPGAPAPAASDAQPVGAGPSAPAASAPQSDAAGLAPASGGASVPAALSETASRAGTGAGANGSAPIAGFAAGGATGPRAGGPIGPAPFAGTLLIADAGNNRLLEVTPAKRIVWQFPAPGSQAAGSQAAGAQAAGSLAAGQTFHYPDDAFFSADGRYITVNEELSHTIAIIDYAAKRIVWQHGQPGVPGSDLQHFHTPDDAHLLPDGQVVVADIKNCRIMFIPASPALPGLPAVPRALGGPADCSGKPGTFAMPNGVTPLPDGHFLITEIRSHYIKEIDAQGQVLRVVTAPVNYASDAYPTPRGTLIVSDYHSPGRVVEIDWSGRILWSFPGPGSSERLDRPSIAFELPSPQGSSTPGNVVIVDDHRDRVIIVDRQGDVLWQYGVTDVPGAAPGYLNTPDGIDIH